MEGDVKGTHNITASDKGLTDSTPQAAISSKSRGRTSREWLVILTLVFSDILLALVVFGLAAALQEIRGYDPISQISTAVMVSRTVVWIGVRALLGLYPGYGLNSAEELRRQTYAVLGALALTAIFVLGFQVGDQLSPLLVGLNFLGLLLLAPILRHFVKWVLHKSGLWGNPVAILGVGETGKQLVRTLDREWGLGLRPISVFDFGVAPQGGLLEGVPPYGGTVNDALTLARKQRIDTIIFAMPQVRREHIARFVSMASHSFRKVIIMPNLTGVTTSAVVARDFAGALGVEIKQNLLNPWALRAKRVLDLMIIIAGGTLVLLLMLVISLLVWMSSRGPVIYRDQRMGRDGKLFSCLKFQTMVPDAEAILQRMIEEDSDIREQYEKYHKVHEDRRVTRIGRFLRKTSLDELPQLWNVLRGEMSLVGPRPYLPRESDKIGSVQGEILRVPPGITGPWQVAGRNDTSFSERVQIDAYYVRDWSVWLDLVLLARTVEILVLGRGAY